MNRLREVARGQPCMIRSPVCNNDPETTVLAHVRMIGISGMGMKAPDLLGAWSCSMCHALVDGQVKSNLTLEARRLLHLEGCMRTLAALIEDEEVQW
jgi:Protein of unknown function (DUF1364)